jgi:TonB family protein
MTSAAEPPSANPPEETARAVLEPLTAPVGLAWSKPSTTAWLRLAALLAALMAHAAVLYWITREPSDTMAGGHGRLLDAVNISMVNTLALEARPDVNAPPAPAAADAVEAKEGMVATKAGSQQPEEEKRQADKLPEMPIPPEAVEAPSIVKPQEQERKEASIPADVGGAAARGTDLRAENKSAPAAASPGAVREYERYVIQALAKVKLKRGLGVGTVRLSLVVSPDGEIASLEVIKSSGNRKLDDEALAAVRRDARFPRPPPGLTEKHRWFQFPANFR